MCRARPGGDGLFATIELAKEAAANTSDKLLVTTRPEKDIFGAALADEVRSEIRSADVLVCDITRPNLNDYYEIGYAIGLRKPIAPVINRSFGNAAGEVIKSWKLLPDGFVTFKCREISTHSAATTSGHVCMGEAQNTRRVRADPEF